MPPSATRISIHAPHAGSDLTHVAKITSALDFNPRSPCGERRAGRRDYAAGTGISIHAPHAGSDSGWLSGIAITSYFNPRSPCGERRGFDFLVPSVVEFQSTLPMRGATFSYKKLKGRIKISIHAPHAGSDFLAIPQMIV